jgi:hypothetical protein
MELVLANGPHGPVHFFLDQTGSGQTEIGPVRTAFLLILFLSEILSGYNLVQGGGGSF